MPPFYNVSLFVLLQLVDEEFDALEGFFYVLEHGILELLENVETFLHHLDVSYKCPATLCQIDTYSDGLPVSLIHILAAM